MKMVVTLLTAAALGCGVGAGCDGDLSAPQAPTGKTRKNWSPAPRYDPYQTVCPVCGKAIEQGHWVDVETEQGTKRLFFDREDCVEEFRSDRQKYLDKYDSTWHRTKRRGSSSRPTQPVARDRRRDVVKPEPQPTQGD